MTEVLKFFLSNDNVLNAIDNEYYYLVFKMARNLEFTESQYRELVNILIDADIYPDKAEDDRIKLCIEKFNYMLDLGTFPRNLDTLIKISFSTSDKIGFNDITIKEIISEAFMQNRFPDYELRNIGKDTVVYRK